MPNYADFIQWLLLVHLDHFEDSECHSSCTYVFFSLALGASLLKKIFGAALDAVQLGPYRIQNCKSNNDAIVNLLYTLTSTIRPVFADLASSPSSDVYTAFFKEVSDVPRVRDVFTNITVGASVVPEPGTPSSSPIFYCVDAIDQVTFLDDDRQVDAYTRCQSYDDAPAMALLTTPYIVICPVFFEHPAIPAPSPETCYTVDVSQNRFVQDGKSLVRYQLWHIMHELVHYYVYSATQKRVDVYGINACLILSGRIAILNPQSYTYYVASMFSVVNEYAVQVH